jgi:hypothetical protein
MSALAVLFLFLPSLPDARARPEDIPEKIAGLADGASAPGARLTYEDAGHPLFGDASGGFR